MSTESSLVSHARYELELLEAAAAKDEDPSALKMQKEMTADVLAVVDLISTQGHSGGSVGYMLNLVKKCVLQKNLTPLTGEDHEWFYHGPEMGDVYQNKRYGAVFKNSKGRAYYLDGIVGVDPNGSTYTGGSTPICYIEFPYTPSTKYLPRMSLIPRAEDEELDYTNFLFGTVQEVLDYYESMGIIQPPEDEHVVRLEGCTAVLAQTDGGVPVCDTEASVKE